uniref:Uncharacterized protein n=1 Tax=Grammatophora oceanica TaxID=210454 RepID=A0A7S1UQD9_9STRA|mmetsp:Transcript_13008/g.19197  ORF Transcript_13008/g.19197 Transcript_13008/m.19197 type:complete len:162 (+) Transcript_13008:163-648(+)
MRRVGTSTLQQRIHSAVGIGSLLFGGMHCATVLQHGFAQPISNFEIVALGSLHTLTAIMGLPRLDFKSKREAARNALIWPVPLQNLWYMLACLTEWAQHGSDVIVSMYGLPFTAFTTCNLLIALWQTSMSYVSGGTTEAQRQKSGIWFESPALNAFITFVT